MLKMLGINKIFNKVVAKFNCHFYSSTITNIVEIDYNGYVYNLSIDDDETYFADGFLVHNCRSIRVPIVKEEYQVVDLRGERGAVGASGKTSVSDKTTFNSWLKKQPADFQDDYFKQFKDGEERAKLFRSGGLSVDKFTDDKGIVLSLDELKAKEALAFEKAGISG